MPEESAFADAAAGEVTEAEKALGVVEDEGRSALEGVQEAAEDASQRAEPSDATSDSASGSAGRRPRAITDTLYGALPLARWAQTLLDLPHFARLAGVSLSDAPGELLFKHAFPSRLTHSLGVYYLARQARPRDRALHAAALAHDLGHGPFSHLTEPLMIERLGMDHEQRGAALLRQALAEAPGQAARLLTWLDPDEVTALMLGGGPEGRGLLLNGLMDYDNLDNVARFLHAAGLGEPGYDPRALARDLRVIPPAGRGQPFVALSPDAAPQAHAWLADRRRVYRYLGEGERNLAIHGMLRKAVDLAAQAGQIEPAFFDATDAQALQLLRNGASAGAALLSDAVASDALYTRVWEATAPAQADALAALFAQGQTRLGIEERIATEAGLRPHEVVLSYTVARGERALPPIIATLHGRAEPLSRPLVESTTSPVSAPPQQAITLLVTRAAGRDYQRRARMAAERALGALGAIPRPLPDLA